MNNKEFNLYKSNIRDAIRKTLAFAPSGTLDESAFPAYAHPNPVINWLFWQRLRKVMTYIEPGAPYELVLDFGCGSGVLLPFLAGVSRRVTALDVDLIPFGRMRAHVNFPSNIEAYDAQTMPLEKLSGESFDFITALDVLEHVDDLASTVRSLLWLLKPGGQLIVSGPTENVFYRYGRRLAGPEYSGEYHERGIAEVRRELEALARVEPIATLYWPVPLFELFAAVV
jgi:2-polyprenyl-3-methyl-5-hydroxy-6-metoxy-1,4-benzoquinol methylase